MAPGRRAPFNGGNTAYMAALSNLDSDMPQYIADNTDDERSHAAFLNAYLQSKGAAPVNLDEFRTLPSSKATGARQIGRLTDLQSLNSLTGERTDGETPTVSQRSETTPPNRDDSPAPSDAESSVAAERA